MAKPYSNGNTREKIKSTALILFAQRGIDAVSVRQISVAAGQRHVGAVSYYFSSKDELVREILADGARIIDERRLAAIRFLEGQGHILTVRDIVNVIINSSIIEGGHGEEAHYARFFVRFSEHRRDLFADAVLNRLDCGFRLCVDHLRRLLPDVPRTIFNRRLTLMLLLIGNSLSARETVISDTTGASQVLGGAIWLDAALLIELALMCEQMMSAPIEPVADAPIP